MTLTNCLRQRFLRAHIVTWTTILGIFCAAPVAAQMDTATLVGRVADSSGKVIAKARVVLVDIDRNTKSRVQSNNAGLYSFPAIRPSHYRIEVSAPTYKTVSVTLTIYVQDDIQQNFRMAAGSPFESVVIAANGTPVETTGAVGTVVEQTLVRELPLNGRSFQTLFQLTPGVVITATTFASQGQFSVNGQRTNTNYFIIDGTSGNVAIAAGVNHGQSAGGSLPAVTAFGGTNSLVSTDDVQEFAVLTSSYGPEFGRTPGAQVSIVTRSGTNEFHGGVFDYVRNDAFDANDWFANRNNLKRAALRQNDYGGLLGGPIRKDKTFFFGSYEGLRLRQPALTESDVPSLAARNTAPALMRPFFQAYPLPNGADEGNGLARATYAFSNPSSLDAISLRIDQHVGEFLSMFARYDRSTSNRKQRGAAINSLSTVTDTQFDLQTLTAGLTWRISPQMINDLRVNWSESSALGRDQLDGFGGAVPLLPPLVFPTHFTQQSGLFQFLPAIRSQALRLSFGRNISSAETQTNIIDSLSYQLRSHLFKTGIDLRASTPEVAPAAYTQQIVFPDIGSSLTATRTLATILAAVSVHSVFKNYSAYIQDVWKPTMRLSVTCGIRWDYSATPSGRGDNGLRPFAVTGINDLPNLALASPGSALYRSPSDNFAPRVGFAYELITSSNRESVISGSAGMFYDLGNGPAGNAFDGTNFPFSALKLLVGAPFPLNPLDATPPSITIAPPFRPLVAFPPILRLPYTWQWNIGIRQSLGEGQSLNLRYVGASAHSLLRTEEYVGGAAMVPEAFTQLLFTNNAGYSNYNAFQLRFQRRAKRGAHVIASYAFSHSLDNVSSDSVFTGIPGRFVNPHSDYGPSDFDIRHTATIALDYSPPLTSTSRLARAILSNWSMSPIVMLRSSPPVDTRLSRDIGFGTYDFHPDLVPGLSLYLDDPGAPGGRRLNPSALSVSSAPRQGNLGRNSFRGFSLLEVDLAMRRRFRVTERVSLQARVEGFNLLNHPNFAAPSGHFGSVDSQGNFHPQTGFGVSQMMLNQGLQSGSIGSGFSPLYQIGAPRSLQFALKVEF